MWGIDSLRPQPPKLQLRFAEFGVTTLSPSAALFFIDTLPSRLQVFFSLFSVSSPPHAESLSKPSKMASEKAPLPFGYTFMAGERIPRRPRHFDGTSDS
jgi:hypothetical protein